MYYMVYNILYTVCWSLVATVDWLAGDWYCLSVVEWSELKALVSEVSELHIPAPADMLRPLNNVVREAGECALVAGHLARRLALIGSVHCSSFIDLLLQKRCEFI